MNFRLEDEAAGWRGCVTCHEGGSASCIGRISIYMGVLWESVVESNKEGCN